MEGYTPLERIMFCKCLLKDFFFFFARFLFSTIGILPFEFCGNDEECQGPFCGSV